jgi:hypothetical protein
MVLISFHASYMWSAGPPLETFDEGQSPFKWHDGYCPSPHPEESKAQTPSKCNFTLDWRMSWCLSIVAFEVWLALDFNFEVKTLWSSQPRANQTRPSLCRTRVDQGGRLCFPQAGLLLGPRTSEKLFENAPAQADGHAPDCAAASEGNAGGITGEPGRLRSLRGFWMGKAWCVVFACQGSSWFLLASIWISHFSESYVG